MIEQWPSERHSEKSLPFADSKSSGDFLPLIALLDETHSKSFEDIVIWIVKQDGDLAELEHRSAQLDVEIAKTLPDSKGMLMTVSCAAALAHSPSLQVWDKINTFKHNSWQPKYWLGEAMIAYAEIHSFARNAYIQLAQVAFIALDNFSLKSKSERTNKERDNSWAHWSERQDKLDEIWWGLRGGHDFMSYEAELPLFQVFYKFEPDKFIHTISNSSNPYLVSALLFIAGIGAFSPRLSEWKKMVAQASLAFDADGKWNGSVLMPLLLVEARNRLLETSEQCRHSNATTEEIEQVKQEIISTSKLIANSLFERKDYSGILVRWTSWLMRKTFGQTAKESADPRSASFADVTLIDELGRKLIGQSLPTQSPEDAPLWESWCYRCVLGSFAYNGYMQAQDWTSFANEWNLSPEDWASSKGRLLRERAGLITALNKEIPGMAANLLAYPIVQSPNPTEVWMGLWNKAIFLREIIEFGDSDVTEDEYRSRSEAGELSLILFSIGLAIFDQCAARTFDNNAPGARSIVILFNALSTAIHEMREIDTTLNHDEWFSAVQHLAVRRMIWEGSSHNQQSAIGYQVFNNTDTPTIPEILSNMKGNVVELVSILQALLVNNPDISKLKADLNAASIDLSNTVDSIRRLNQYHLRKYPIDEAQIQKLESLI